MRLPLLHWRLLLAAVLFVTAVAGQTCYWPNGVEATQAVACPVAGGTEVAACCFQNHYCMSNGLCFSQTELSFYRGACTDQNWSRSGCAKYCDKEEITGGVPGRHCGVALCGDKKFACQNSGNCANYTFGVPAGQMLLNEYLKSDLGNLATTTVTATAASGQSTGTAATCSSTAAESSFSNGISTGAAAGIGVGIGAPLALAIAALTVMLLREKRKTRAALSSQVDSSGGTGPSSPWAKSERTAYVPVEMHGQPVPNEMSSNHDRRHELS